MTRDALGTRHAQVVLPDDVEHGRARRTRHKCRQTCADGKRGQYQAQHSVFIAAGRQPPELEREQHYQKQTQPEIRHGQAKQS